MGLAVRTPVITKNAGWSTQSYSLSLAFSTALGVFLLPFMGKFIQLIKSATNFLHALGQSLRKLLIFWFAQFAKLIKNDDLWQL